MRNTLKISAIALALVMVLGVVMAFAATSTVSITNIVDEDNNPVAIGTDPQIVDDADEAAAAEGQDETASTLNVLWNGEIGSTYANKTLTFTLSGVADGTKVYLYHYTGTPAAWKVEGNSTVSGGKVSFTMPATTSPFALVASTAIPATGDNSNIALWGGLMVAAIAVAAGTVVYSRKRKNEA